MRAFLAALALVASPVAAQPVPSFGPATTILAPLSPGLLYGPSPYAYAGSNISERTLGDGQTSLYGGGLIGPDMVGPLVKGLGYGVFSARPLLATEKAAIPGLIAAEEKATGHPVAAPLKAALLADTWLSAGRSTTAPHGYGRYRTVYRGCTDAACWNAPLWAFNRTHQLEIDIEVIKGTTFSAAIHSSAGSKGVRVAMPTPRAWHWISFDYLPGLVIWYIDDAEVARLTYPLTNAAGAPTNGPIYVNANLSIGSKDCTNWVCMPTATTRAPLQMTIGDVTYAPLLAAPPFAL